MMHKSIRWILMLLLLAAGMIPGTAGAAPPQSPVREPNANDLINAVNNLRASRGMSALRMHPILMQTAQSQASALLGSGGAVGHSRPGGMSYTEQLIQLGYPLAGDLSLGGFRSENYVFGTGLTVNEAIQFWLGDEPHTNTMLSPNYLDIGAGVAFGSDGTAYYVVDTARPTSSGQPQSGAASVLTVTADPSQLLSQYIIPVSLSTARPDGNVYHKVQYGQSLWAIAIAYGTTIKNLQALNNLSDTTVYDGQVLLVLRGATQPPGPSVTPSVTATYTPFVPTPTSPQPATSTATSTPQTQTPAAASRISPGAILVIVLVAMLLGGALAAVFIRRKD